MIRETGWDDHSRLIFLHLIIVKFKSDSVVCLFVNVTVFLFEYIPRGSEKRSFEFVLDKNKFSVIDT